MAAATQTSALMMQRSRMTPTARKGSFLSPGVLPCRSSIGDIRPEKHCLALAMILMILVIVSGLKIVLRCGDPGHPYLSGPTPVVWSSEVVLTMWASFTSAVSSSRLYVSVGGFGIYTAYLDSTKLVLAAMVAQLRRRLSGNDLCCLVYSLCYKRLKLSHKRV